MPTLRLEIVTPLAKTYSEDVDAVTIPGADGELGILPLHVPLFTALKPGELRVRKGAQEILLATGGGFAEVMPDRVSILTDMSVQAAEVDEAAQQAAVDRAKAALADKTLTSEAQAEAEAALARSLAQLHIKRRHASGSSGVR
jgi:F-type H+-transporting ATPase subunit epsilon